MTDSTHELRNKHGRIKITHDIFIVTVVTVLITFYALFFDLSEKFYQWSRLWEAYQVDEFVFPLLSFCIGLIWFSWRRYSEAKMESKANTILLSENRQLIRNLTQNQEHERLSLAQELHDVFAQYLTALRAHAELIQATTATENNALVSNAQKIVENVDKLHDITRSLLKSLRPPILKFGIIEAIKELVTEWRQTHSDMQCQLTFHGDEPVLNEEEMLAIYRTLQEGLSNIAKHTQARHLDIQLSFSKKNDLAPAMLRLQLINDDSTDFELPAQRSGLGMIGIRERATMLNGHYELGSHPPHGTVLKFSFPIKGQVEAK